MSVGTLTNMSGGVTWLKTMFLEGFDKVNICVDDLLCIHQSPTMAPGNLSAATRKSAGLPPTPAWASAPTTAAAFPESDVPGDGPLLSAGDGLHNASHSSTNVHLSGSVQATSSRQPLFPAECDFEYNQEVATHGCMGPWLDARPQGRHLANTGHQGSGFAPCSQTQWQPDGEGNAYARSPILNPMLGPTTTGMRQLTLNRGSTMLMWTQPTTKEIMPLTYYGLGVLGRG